MASLEARDPTPQRVESVPAGIPREDTGKQTADGVLDTSHGGVSCAPSSSHRAQNTPSCPLPSILNLIPPLERMTLAPPHEALCSHYHQQDDGSGISARNNVAALSTSKLANQSGPKVRGSFFRVS